MHPHSYAKYLEVKIVVFLAFLGEKPDEDDDVGVDNQPADHTHDHGPQSDRSTMVKCQWQGDPQYHQEPGEGATEFQKCQRSVVILEGKEIIPGIRHRAGNDVGQRRQKEDQNHPERVVVVIKGA